MELLVSHNAPARHRSGLRGVSGRVKWYGSLLVLGLAGTAGCLWAMFYTSHSEAVAHNLGMTRVANSLENVLDLLAIPALMFAVILSAYSLQRLYWIYRSANYPDLNKRSRS